MENLISIEPDSVTYQLLIKQWPPQKYMRSFVAIYCGQVPNLSIFLINGTVTLNRNSKQTKIFTPTIIGLSDLLSNQKSTHDVTVFENSTVSMIDKGTLLKKTALFEAFFVSARYSS